MTAETLADDAWGLQADLRATRAERDKMIDATARLLAQPPEVVARAYFVRYTDTAGGQR